MAKFCPSCRYREADDNALFCNKCGFPFPQTQPQRPVAAAAPAPVRRPAPLARRPPRRRKSGSSGFLSFESLITANHLRLIYLIGAALIVLFAIMGITGGFATKGAVPDNASYTNTTAVVQHPASSPLFWIGFLVLGNLLWRMFCELFALQSRGSGSGSGEDYDDEPDGYESGYPAAHGGGGQPQYVECPKCAKLVTVGELRECEHCGVQGCVNCIRPIGLVKKKLTCRECFEGK
jgi:hypothetical protein